MSEYCRGEPFLVSLTERHLSVMADESPNPEDAAMAREMASWAPAADEDDEAERAAAVAHVRALIAETLPVEEAYMLRCSLEGQSQAAIAQAIGIAQPSVWGRLQRAKEDLRRRISGQSPLRRVKPRMRIPGLVERQSEETKMQTEQHVNGAGSRGLAAHASAALDVDALALQASLSRQQAEADAQSLVEAVRSRIEAIDAERAALVTSLAEYAGGEATATPAKRKPKPTSRKARPAKSAAPGAVADHADVVAIVARCGANGASSGDIQKGLGYSRDKAGRSLAAATKAGAIRGEGKARGRRYYAVEA